MRQPDPDGAGDDADRRWRGAPSSDHVLEQTRRSHTFRMRQTVCDERGFERDHGPIGGQGVRDLVLVRAQWVHDATSLPYHRRNRPCASAPVAASNESAPQPSTARLAVTTARCRQASTGSFEVRQHEPDAERVSCTGWIDNDVCTRRPIVKAIGTRVVQDSPLAPHLKTTKRRRPLTRRGSARSDSSVFPREGVHPDLGRRRRHVRALAPVVKRFLGDGEMGVSGEKVPLAPT